MNLSLYIAKRYLFSKQRHQVINIISGVAVAGVALATAAMICTLSVFNGFQNVVEKQFTALDPDIKVVPAIGKSFSTATLAVDSVRSMPQLAVVSFSVEDKAMAQYNGRQVMITLKGVGDNYMELTDLSNSLYGRGKTVLQDSLNSYAILGGELMHSLNCGIYFTAPLEIYAPNRGEKVNLTIPSRNFKKGVLHSSGLVFAVNQPAYDANYILTSVDFARRIFRRDTDEATAMEIRVKDGFDVDNVKAEIEDVLGSGFVVLDRYEQQRDVYKVMQIEKFISYVFLTFILLVACFNIIGSLSMLIIEKRDNMNTLRSFGADNKTISNIFVFEGVIVSFVGAVVGILFGLLLCLAQQELGLISTGGSGDFIMESYPVKVMWNDVATVFVTVLATGVLAVWLPVKMLTKKYI